VKKSPEVVALRIEQRVAELRVLAAATVVAWGQSPGLPFEVIADAARADTEKFIQETRLWLDGKGDQPALGPRRLRSRRDVEGS
jgi:hypothetical protein